MTAPWLPPADLKFTCAITGCGEVVEGVEASIDHLRVMHPDVYEPPERWADGGVVYDTSALGPGGGSAAPFAGRPGWRNEWALEP